MKRCMIPFRARAILCTLVLLSSCHNVTSVTDSGGPVSNPQTLSAWTNSVGLELMPITSNAEPSHSGSHQVLRSYISTCSITEELFTRVVGHSPANATRHFAVLGALGAPATNVTWEEAADFCRKLSALENESLANRNYRLPSTVEWDQFSHQHSDDEHCFSYDTRPLHWSVWEWCSESNGAQATRLWWSHPDPFTAVYTFRVVCTSPNS